jgi:hypothetical protein
MAPSPAIQDAVEVIKELADSAKLVLRIVTMPDLNAFPFRSLVGMGVGIVDCHLMTVLYEKLRQVFCKLLESAVVVGHTPCAGNRDFHCQLF